MEIIVRNIEKVYYGRKVVDNVSLNVSQGEIVGLLGPNGAGKTTTFYMVVGMISPESGKIFVDNLDITKLPMYKRARLKIGYLPQETSIFRNVTVEENILAALEFLNITEKEKKSRLEELLEEFNITKIRKSNGESLSGGEKKRTEIARLLATDPKIILFDEPFAGVDPIAVKDIQSLIKEFKKKGIGVLITDHNIDETLSITDRAYIMYNGKILKSGTTKELIDDEMVKEVYLGKNFVLKDSF